ncbi:MAG: zinc dependent phospholipase C family protein [Eubacteriaceae bacterium]|nr:zinc dependent phospholipase C family protein [Eubacteriaceae bacterium]MDD4507644.1 zinc dependent phospholipase C family protein [Eubacteriaceae bacterium]
MSDMLNHYYCGQEAFNNLPADTPLHQAIALHPDAYHLGTQGPDFFYYDMPLPPHKPNNPLGSIIHTRGIDRFFYNGFQYAAGHPEDRSLILSYLAGFSCHHSLDTQSHPFIFYRTGRYDRSRWVTHFYSYFHKYYEVLLDVAFLQYRYKKLAATFNFRELFSPQPHTLTVLDNFYADVMRHTYGIEMQPGAVKRAVRSTRWLSFHFSDLDDYKKNILRRIEKLLNEEMAVSRVFYPMFTNERLVLNLSHNVWHDPCTNQPHQESYPDLFDLSVEQTNQRFQIINRWLTDPCAFSRDAIHLMYGNRSYLTGLPCTDKHKMTHFDIFFETIPHMREGF